jgi:hypothetical protein
MKNYCGVFEDKEENKMEYMVIFNNYQQVIEKYIMQVLTFLYCRALQLKYLSSQCKHFQHYWQPEHIKLMRIYWR